MKSQKHKASVLAVSLIIMGVMLVIALGISFSSLQSRKSSIGSSKSNVAFQNADSGVEIVMQRIKDNVDDTDLNNIDPSSDPVDGCNGIVNSLSIYKVELRKTDGTPVACDDPVSDINTIKSIGYSSQDSRAIEVEIQGRSGPSRIGVFRNGVLGEEWLLDVNGNGLWDGTDTAAYFGATGDIPITGDWGGSGTSKIGVFRDDGSSVTWYLDINGNGLWDGTDTAAYFGATGDIPITGDWNGTGTTKIGVFRDDGSSVTWYLDINGNGLWDGTDTAAYFGATGDIPITGDWNGTGTTKIGVFRDQSGTGTWYLDTNGNGLWNVGIDTLSSFGLGSDLPVTGDWGGSGTSKIGVFRDDGSSVTWYLDINGNGLWDGTDMSPSFGMTGDIPVTGDWD